MNCFCHFEREFSSLLFTHLGSDTVAAGAPFAWVVTSLTNRGSARHFCTALFIAVQKTEHWKALATDWLTTVWLTAATLVSGLDSFVVLRHRRLAQQRPPLRPGYLRFFHELYSPAGLINRTEWAEPSRWKVLPTRAYRQGRQTCVCSPLFGSVRPLPLVMTPVIEKQLADFRGT